MSRARTPLLAGNWKMHGTKSEAVALATALVKAVGRLPGREVLVAPPFTALEPVGAALAGSEIRLGAQNVYWEPKGAFTGEVSAPMLREAGCTHVIVGHSERRQIFGETNETVNKRLAAAIAAGLTPVLCVGETIEEREADATAQVVERQIATGLAGLSAAEVGRCVVAYEPVWAIGTGRTATPEQAQTVHEAIRARLARVADEATAARVRILYGGSVKPDNIDKLMAEPDIDGALVGGASLVAEQFIRIVRFEE
jgi:triosephosphate isomerase (TIM)